MNQINYKSENLRGLPCTTHRADSIPLSIPLTHLPLLLSIPFFPTTQIDSEEFCGRKMQPSRDDPYGRFNGFAFFHTENCRHVLIRP